MAGTESGILSYFDSKLNLRNITSQYSSLIKTVDDQCLVHFIRNIYFEFKNNPAIESEFRQLFKLIEISQYSTGEWIGNINFVYNWLSINNRKARFADILQYVSCYFESESSDSIETFLNIFGFERSASKS